MKKNKGRELLEELISELEEQIDVYEVMINEHEKSIERIKFYKTYFERVITRIQADNKEKKDLEKNV